MSVKQRAWTTAVLAGLAVTSVGVALRNHDLGVVEIRTSGGFGPVDLFAALLLFAATVFLVLPRRLAPWRRITRALVVWTGLLFFAAFAEAAHECGAHDPSCNSSGDPLRALLVWLIGFAVLGAVWLATPNGRAGARRR